LNRSGKFINNLSGSLTYKSFCPTKLPPDPIIEIDDEMLDLLTNAYHILGELNGISKQLMNIELFISMYVRKEALLTSQIEGTQATMDDIFNPYIEDNMNLNVIEVVNYLKALIYANKRILELPLSIRFIKEVHQALLSGLRGDDKSPGELRNSQNWIGPAGSHLKNARFIPPNVDDMHVALGDLEKYIHEGFQTDRLTRIALIHYQFETIHPFLDGNGRIGRLLIMLLLKEYKLLDYDTLYISYFFKRNRTEYYDRLMDVRFKDDYESWIKFFLNGIIDASNDAINTINLIIKLHKKNIDKINNFLLQSKITVYRLFGYVESHPVIDIKQASIAINKSFNTTSKALKTLIDLGILIQVEGDIRYRVFAYEELLAILREGTE